MAKSGNGEDNQKDYLIIKNLQYHSIERTLNMYSQDEWVFMQIFYSKEDLYSIVFRRRLTNEY